MVSIQKTFSLQAGKHSAPVSRELHVPSTPNWHCLQHTAQECSGVLWWPLSQRHIHFPWSELNCGKIIVIQGSIFSDVTGGYFAKKHFSRFCWCLAMLLKMNTPLYAQDIISSNLKSHIMINWPKYILASTPNAPPPQSSCTRFWSCKSRLGEDFQSNLLNLWWNSRSCSLVIAVFGVSLTEEQLADWLTALQIPKHL